MLSTDIMQKNTQQLLSVRIVVSCALLLLLVSLGCEKKSKRLEVGDKAPDFSATAMDGSPLQLSAWKGKPVILRFWETSCRFCQADAPVINGYYEKNKNKGLTIVYISVGAETTQRITAFTNKFDIDFPVIFDTEQRIAPLYNVQFAPQTIFIAPDQKIIAALPGGVGEAELDEIIGKFL